MTPTEPLTSTQDFARDEIEAPPDTTAEAGDKPISAALLQSLGDALPGADYYGITTLTRPGLALTTVRPFRDHHEIIQQPAPLHLLKVGEHPWRLVHLPTDVARIEIADVVQAEGAPSLLVCVTRQAGLFRSRDAGRTWHQANFDEATLEKGAEIKLIVAPGPTVYALVVLYREPGDDLNPLYRLERRTWIVRWRLGLAALLQPDAG